MTRTITQVYINALTLTSIVTTYTWSWMVDTVREGKNNNNQTKPKKKNQRNLCNCCYTGKSKSSATISWKYTTGIVGERFDFPVYGDGFCVCVCVNVY